MFVNGWLINRYVGKLSVGHSTFDEIVSEEFPAAVDRLSRRAIVLTLTVVVAV